MPDDAAAAKAPVGTEVEITRGMSKSPWTKGTARWLLGLGAILVAAAPVSESRADDATAARRYVREDLEAREQDADARRFVRLDLAAPPVVASRVPAMASRRIRVEVDGPATLPEPSPVRRPSEQLPPQFVRLAADEGGVQPVADQGPGRVVRADLDGARSARVMRIAPPAPRVVTAGEVLRRTIRTSL